MISTLDLLQLYSAIEGKSETERRGDRQRRLVSLGSRAFIVCSLYLL